MWLQPVENFDIVLQREENWHCSNAFENWQKIFQLQLLLSTFEKSQLQLQLQLLQNRVINYNFVNKIPRVRRVARNSQWGGYLGGLGAETPAAGGMGLWGRSPQRSKILPFFAEITSF